MEIIESIIFDTFIPFDDKHYDDDNYFDTHIMLFEVPLDWVERYLEGIGYTIESFNDEYTWDDTWQMYESACVDDVIVYENVVERI